jgi:RimJ/RimL family protein N-acetyltransferase
MTNPALISSESAVINIGAFDAHWARVVSDWVNDDDALRLLAPATTPPLTAAKVLDWIKTDGFAATGWRRGALEPVAYGEVNPMQRRAGAYWLGHVIVNPNFRRRGYGLSFVRALLRQAFEHRRAKLVALIVFPENIPAIECYLRAGFRAAGEERHRFRAGGPEERLLRFEINRARLGYRS